MFQPSFSLSSFRTLCDRKRLSLPAALLLLAASAGCTGDASSSPGPKVALANGRGGEATRPPNVVFILADDLGYGELGSYGQEKIRTPNLDRLAAEGMRFSYNYSGAPVCAPSRNVLLTGKHLGHTTIRGNLDAVDDQGERVEGQWPIPEEAYTLAELFGEHGYVTGAMGKWGLGPVGSSGDPNAQGFDRFVGYNCQRVAHSYYPPHLWVDDHKMSINQEPVPGHMRQPEGPVRMEDWFADQYAPDLIVEAALDFLDEHRAQPFFLYLPFVEPHVAMQPPKEWVERYPEDWDRKVYRGAAGYTPHPRPRAGYAAMVSDLDEHVGLVLRKLDELGLSDETLVVFTSDNGTTHGSDRDADFGVGGVDAPFFRSTAYSDTASLRGFKGSVYEGGLRVPLIVRWPGEVDANVTNHYVTYFPDWFATFAELLGSPLASGDGISLLPTLRGEPERPERNPMVWVFPEYGGQVAVRFGDYKLVHQRLDDLPSAGAGWELYDLAADPGELHNLAAEYPQLVRQGVEILERETDDNPLFPVPIPP